MKLPKILNRGKRKFSCEQDPNTGDVHCVSFRQFEDGSSEQLANVDFKFDANCSPVPGHMFEHEEGELKALEKKALPLLKSQCKNRPSDY